MKYPLGRRLIESEQPDYTIETFADFQELKTRIDSSTEGTSTRFPGASNGSGFAGKRFRMTNDIDFNNYQWIGIGWNGSAGTPKSFKGNFDGGGFSILNLNFSNTMSIGNNIGLFLSIENAQIHDLSIKGNITLNVNGLVSTLVYSINGNCSIERIVNYVNVSTQNDASVIGICQAGSNVTISDIINVGDLTSKNFNSAGIIRYVWGFASISRVCNFGTLMNMQQNAGAISVGILCKDNGTTYIENCYNAGLIQGWNMSAGILNTNTINTSSVKKCYNIGMLARKQPATKLSAMSVEIPSIYEDNYYDSLLVVDSGVYNGVAKTTQELQSGTLFNDGVWIERAGKYPILPFMQDLQNLLLYQ